VSFKQMEADPDELLVWLKGDGGGERDLQISALEQLCKFNLQGSSSFIDMLTINTFNEEHFMCKYRRFDRVAHDTTNEKATLIGLVLFLGMLVLMCDNIDRCFEQ
jgi:hypothetical protein